MNATVTDIKLAILAPTPLTQSGMAYFIDELLPQKSCMVTADSFEQLQTQGVLPRSLSHLVLVLGGRPEIIENKVSQLLWLSEYNPQMHIVVLVYEHDMEHIRKLYSKPRVSLLTRHGSHEQMLQDMKVALSGKKICNTYMGDNKQTLPYKNTTVLTPAERNILIYLSRGMRVSDIATMLHRSMKTISAHKCNCMRKLGARNDSELFRKLSIQMAELSQDNRFIK